MLLLLGLETGLLKDSVGGKRRNLPGVLWSVQAFNCESVHSRFVLRTDYGALTL